MNETQKLMQNRILAERRERGEPVGYWPQDSEDDSYWDEPAQKWEEEAIYWDGIIQHFEGSSENKELCDDLIEIFRFYYLPFAGIEDMYSRIGKALEKYGVLRGNVDDFVLACLGRGAI